MRDFRVQYRINGNQNIFHWKNWNLMNCIECWGKGNKSEWHEGKCCNWNTFLRLPHSPSRTNVWGIEIIGNCWFVGKMVFLPFNWKWQKRNVFVYGSAACLRFVVRLGWNIWFAQYYCAKVPTIWVAGNKYVTVWIRSSKRVS